MSVTWLMYHNSRYCLYSKIGILSNWKENHTFWSRLERAWWPVFCPDDLIGTKSEFCHSICLHGYKNACETAAVWWDVWFPPTNKTKAYAFIWRSYNRYPLHLFEIRTINSEFLFFFFFSPRWVGYHYLKSTSDGSMVEKKLEMHIVLEVGYKFLDHFDTFFWGVFYIIKISLDQTKLKFSSTNKGPISVMIWNNYSHWVWILVSVYCVWACYHPS